MGRSRKPDEIKRLQGDPGKRLRKKRQPRQAVASPAPAPGGQPDQPAAAIDSPKTGELVTVAAFDFPDFLTGERERRIFRLVAEELLPRNVIRETDFNLLGRYAALMALWCDAKADLEASGGRWYTAKSKHNPEGLMRRNPAFTDVLDLNAELRMMEPQLALTPLARAAIMSRIMQVPQNPGGMFDKPAAQDRNDQADAPAADENVSPLGFVNQAPPGGRLN